MNYQEFLCQVKLQLTTRLGNDHMITIRSVTKNNNQKLDALTIMEPGRHIAPTIYLNPYYQILISGRLTFNQILDKILDFHREYMPPEHIDPEFFSNYEKVKKRIAYKLIHYQRNQELLKQIPHIPYLDLAICFYCYAQTGPGSQATILIHNEHLEMWKIDETTLYETARLNTPMLFPHTLTSMNAFMENYHDPFFQEIKEAPSFSIPMYILSNKSNLFGASCMLYDNLLSQLSIEFHNSFYILPSSLHELILIPSQQKDDLACFSAMVQDVNKNHVAPVDILSDHAYFFNKASQEILCF
ncbi:MAG: DUF5688 family protein [Lachnospiraceae bacterium]